MQIDVSSRAAIVVIAFNRLPCVKRLISSVMNADYDGDQVDLIISIDNSGSDQVVNYAKTLSWSHGFCYVMHRDRRLGLKNHVLACGQLTNNYKFICVLEDDLFVSPQFYIYSKQAIDHFANFNDVAGISLYKYQWNQYVDKPFEVFEDGSDVFFLQIASSWGQVWNKKWWDAFIAWMEGKDDNYIKSDLLPSAVSGWSSKSWLKFHHRYLVDANKYFIYPKVSLTTNFSDVGEHASFDTSTYQVPLLMGRKEKFFFPIDFDNVIKYDSFFECVGLGRLLGISDSDLDVDLFESRNCKKRYLLTTKILNYKIVNSFALSLRPIESNVIFGMQGKGVFFYDKSVSEKNLANRIEFWARNSLYFLKSRSKKDYFLLSLYLYFISAVKKLGNLYFFKRKIGV